MPSDGAGQALEFRVLGPLEMWRNGTPVPVAGERQRAVLALLLLRANEVVATDQLVEALFGPEAPESASNSVQAAVSRLRQRLDSGILMTRPPGYVLRVQPGRLDLARFEELVAGGGRMLAAGDAASAASILREALALWRGPPLADLSNLEFAAGEIRRLDALRLSAVMQRVDADLALGRHAELVPELDALVAANPLQERLCGQLMLALYRSGRQADALAIYRQTRDLLGDELGLEPSRALKGLERAILRHDQSLEFGSSVGRESVLVCPFKGLASFGAADADYYYGRERVVADLVARLADSAFVGVIGPSGSGKSSLVQAGLRPALAEGALPGSGEWEVLVIRPGDHRLDNLPTTERGRRLLLVVDQLEEVFTACHDEEERADFLNRLVELAEDRDRRTVVVVALRVDFYGRCAHYSSFASLLSSSHVLLGPMERDEFARAITGPAERAGLDVEPELVDALVADVTGEPGALPLLSASLLELWRLRDGRRLRLTSYRQAGGVRGAVARLAENGFAKLNPTERPVARAVLLRLAGGDDSTVVRRRVQLEEVVGDAVAARVVAVLTEERVLTVSDGTLEVSHEAVLTEWPRLREWLAEDREGRRLRARLAVRAREWSEGGHEPAELYGGARLSAVLEWAVGREHELNESEREFLAESRSRSELEASRQLRQNRRLRGALAAVGLLLALAVIAGFVALRQRSSAEAVARVALARQLGAAALSEPRVDVAMLLAREGVTLDRSPQTEGALLAALLRSPNVLRTFSTSAIARSGGLALSPDGRTLALTASNGALMLYDTATGRLRETVANFGYGSPVAYTPDGSALVGVGGPGFGFIDIRDARTLRLRRELRTDPNWLVTNGGAIAPVLAPDERALFFAYDFIPDGGLPGPTYIDRWDLRSGKLTWARVPIVGAMDLAASGRYLVVSGKSAVAVLDAATLRRLRVVSLVHESITAEAIRSDGRQIAIGSPTGRVDFVDLESGRVSSAVGANDASVQAMSYSPDGRTLVSFAEDGDGAALDARAGSLVERLTGQTSRVLGAVFSRDGRTLWTSSLDGHVFEWDTGNARRFGKSFTVPPAPRQGGRDIPRTPPLAISPDGSRFAVRSGGRGVVICSTRTLRCPTRLPATTGEVTGIAWGQTGLLATTGEDGTVELWSSPREPRLLRNLRGLRSLSGGPETVESVAFSPDGGLVAAGDVSHVGGYFGGVIGTIAVWDVRSGRRVWTWTSTEGAVDALAFSPDGGTLAAALEDGAVHLFDWQTNRVRWTVDPVGNGQLGFETLAYSPKGILATGSHAGVVQLWDPRTHTEIGHLIQAANAPVAAIAFNPTGDEFATTEGGSLGVTRIWASSTQQQFGGDLPGELGRWENVRYTPDGAELLTLGSDGRGSAWPTTLEQWQMHACAVAARNLTHEEWSQYITGRGYRKTCPEFPTGS